MKRLIRRVRTFGFHLARLDVRQDSRVHDEALSALFNDSEWLSRDIADRVTRLQPFASGARAFEITEDTNAKTLHDVFETLHDARTRYGNDAIGLYIISMARSAADVLAVLALARYGGLGHLRDAESGGDAKAPAMVPLDIAPLFETVDDLKNAPATLRALLDDPLYRQHLTARGNQQWVMLGYSDSGKDAGTLASRWGLQRAQVELLELAQAAGIRLAFFHGRGGSASPRRRAHHPSADVLAARFGSRRAARDGAGRSHSSQVRHSRAGAAQS